MTLHTRASAPDSPADIAEVVRRQKPAHSLQQALYNSPAAFERDFERIFRRHWILAGHASMAPQAGDYFLHEMAAESIIIVRGREGELRAFANVCRHRGSQICTSSQGRATVLVCPYHAWAYNLDGSLRSARHMPADFDKASYGLKPVAIEVIEGLVFISLAEAPLSLELARKTITEAYAPYGWAAPKSPIAKHTQLRRTGSSRSKITLSAIIAHRRTLNIPHSTRWSSPLTRLAK